MTKPDEVDPRSSLENVGKMDFIHPQNAILCHEFFDKSNNGYGTRTIFLLKIIEFCFYFLLEKNCYFV